LVTEKHVFLKRRQVKRREKEQEAENPPWTLIPVTGPVRGKAGCCEVLPLPLKA